MAALFRNNAVGTLASAVADGTVTTFTLAAGDGANFGTIGSADAVRAVVVDTSATPETVLEYVDITAVSTDTLTVTREVEDAATYPAGALAAGLTVAAVVTAGTLAAKDAVILTVEHGTDATVARPSGATAVYWIGSVEPTNAADNDLWIGGS